MDELFHQRVQDAGHRQAKMQWSGLKVRENVEGQLEPGQDGLRLPGRQSRKMELVLAGVGPASGGFGADVDAVDCCKDCVAGRASVIQIVHERRRCRSCRSTLVGKNNFVEFHTLTVALVPESQDTEAPPRQDFDGRPERCPPDRTLVSWSGQHHCVELSKQLLEQPTGLLPRSHP